MKATKLRNALGHKSQELFTSISKALSSISCHSDLQKVHALTITFGFQRSVFFSGKLISRYSQFRDPNAALLIFRVHSPADNVYLWNTIIRTMVQCGLYAKALEFYTEMIKSKVKPDSHTFPSVINACANLMIFDSGRMLHKHVVEAGFKLDLYINNALIDMYSRFGELIKAKEVFDGMRVRDLVSWNSLISGYSSNGYWEEALQIYFQLRMAGLVPDSYTITSILLACGGLGEVEEGDIVHGLAERIGIKKDIIVSNGLLAMYFKFDRSEDCQRIFNEMVFKDNVTWNTMICGSSQLALYNDPIRLFLQMAGQFQPDMLTVTSVLRACTHVGDLKVGRFVHDYMRKNGYECDNIANNIIINMYAKCGDLLAARKYFESMKSRDLVSWNSLINGYVGNGAYEDAIFLFKIMKLDTQPDSVSYLTLFSMCMDVTYLDYAKSLHCDIIKQGFDSTQVLGNALIDMYGECGKIEEALKQFESMNTRDIVTWNTVIAACLHSEDSNLGFEMVRRMRIGGMLPDVATLLSSLPLCSLLVAKRQGKEIHGYILRLGFESHVSVGNALVEMYSNIGILRSSILVFNQMKTRDIVSWTALISAYGMYGEGRKALKAFEEMKETGIVPDHIVYVSVIYACSHSGLVQEGQACFDEMMKDYNIEPRLEHYACVVDLLSRSGLLAEAEDFILSMPLQPDISIWGSLLSACRATANIEIAERVSEHIIGLDSADPGYYVLASNVYASLGKWDQVRKIRKSIKARSLRKKPGCSWVEIQNKVYYFGAGDKFFEQFEEVKKLLTVLSAPMVKEGYVADFKFVLHDIKEDEKMDMLCGHSERLAIAFGLLNTKQGTSLQIIKNLRVCGDCHTATKYISKIMKREILVRDANRFHLFKDGTCSCGDQW